MKLVIHKVNKKHLPIELLEPNFFLDEMENSFIKGTYKEREVTYTSSELELNNINFFIGANNSGKSRFMRGLLRLENINKVFFAKNESIYSILLRIKNPILIDKERTISQTQLKEIQNKIKSLVFDEIDTNNTIDELYSNEKNELNFSGLFLYKEKLKDFEEELSKIKSEELKTKIKFYIDLFNKLDEELGFAKKNEIRKKTYIPILRSLLTTEHLGEHAYRNTVKKVFFKEKTLSNNISLETGLDLWGRIDKMGRSPKKRDIEKFEFFLSKYFFEGKRVELLARETSESLNLISIAIDNGDFRSANEIGDGIQTLLLLLFPIFTASENEIFYIEEPETNLHPGFQRIFIETLLTNKDILDKNLKFFFTTHSNHFLDLTLRNDKVSFFQFQKIEEGKHLIKTKIKPSKETLDLLGVNNTSVFLANTSLWVEGPTDRLYLSKFLKLYCKEHKLPYLKEDIDYAFFEYGGNLIAHYLFKETKEEIEEVDGNEVKDKINSFALSSKIYLLADNDNAKSGDEKFRRRKVLEELSNNDNFKYQNTIVKEIENLLPVKIVKEFMFELLTNETNIEIVKGINFQRSEYKNVGLGEFYVKEFKECGLKEGDYKKFKTKSGTLSSDYKKKLARFVVDSSYNYDDLKEDNEVLENLIEKLYNFIKNNDKTT
ncbi:ATP-dependent nuclease [Tenacibaculum aiptasiae]|uniref:AAA family ATPase n=1 Tax=Tenacibaculum aiptasiae TaxID=426481 RepID=UPI003B5BC22D